MAIPALPPISLGQDFKLPALDSNAAAGQSSGQGFGNMLADQLKKLDGLQTDASNQAQDLATGKASDIGSVALSIERASIGLELASSVRNKAVEAYQDILRTQI